MVTINSNVCRIATQPVIRRSIPSSSSARETTTTPNAQLSRSPKSLYLLWDEYERGLGGNKAAKDFTERERGAVKYNYYRRKILWEVVERLIRRGHTSRGAIDIIRAAYGQSKSVTQVINLMKDDRARGIQRV